MSFVIYDLETTGLAKGFDQIIQFAGVRTDTNLNVADQFQIRCRLMPHVIPSPEAMRITGLRIEDLTNPALPSHYEMVLQVRRVLERWCPALFLGFNSISFDEEFLRQAFYQCLFDAYLTNTQRSARADVLNLCRVTAALRPDVLVPAQNSEGLPIFKLALLAEANGIVVPTAHEAMSDVTTTLALCRHIKRGASEVWSQFVRFSQKASVEAFITGEDAFLFSETVGNHHCARLVMRIGQHTDQAIRHYCLDLCADLTALRAMSEDELVAFCRSSDRPIVTVRTNAAPTLWALCDALPEHLSPFEEGEILEMVAKLKEDEAFLRRLCQAAQAAEPVYPSSPYVEEQLYERGFPPREDQNRMKRFHEVEWSERAKLADEYEDDRYRRLAQRLVYFERPDLLRPTTRKSMDDEIGRRLAVAAEGKPRWRSIPNALQELQALMEQGLTGDSIESYASFAVYLSDRQASLLPAEMT
ncbi:MAG: exonuclease domain-containing protein [Rhizomicrobium sp.]|jgi:exodeoxyribonuclease-1